MYLDVIGIIFYFIPLFYFIILLFYSILLYLMLLVIILLYPDVIGNKFEVVCCNKPYVFVAVVK